MTYAQDLRRVLGGFRASRLDLPSRGVHRAVGMRRRASWSSSTLIRFNGLFLLEVGVGESAADEQHA